MDSRSLPQIVSHRASLAEFVQEPRVASLPTEVPKSLTTATAGIPQSVTVTAYDSLGNIASGYTGTVIIYGTDAQSVQFYAFTAADAGVHAIDVVLRSIGTQTVIVQDTIDPTAKAPAIDHAEILPRANRHGD